MHQGIVQHSCKPSNEEKNDDVQLDEAATGSAATTAMAREGEKSNLLHEGFLKLGLSYGSFGVLCPRGW